MSEWIPTPCGESVGRATRTAGLPFELTLVESGCMLMARVDGPLDIQTTAGFLERLQPCCAPGRRLVLDLREAEYIDSTGVRALLLLQERLEAVQGEIRLVVRPGSRVVRTLTLLDLQERFAFYESASEAWTRRPVAA